VKALLLGKTFTMKKPKTLRQVDRYRDLFVGMRDADDLADLLQVSTYKLQHSRPAEDAFNALLNYAYGMLYRVVEAAIFDAGLDPQLGVFHQDSWNKPTLSFDLIEPFRAWVDRMIVDFCLKNSLDLALFEVQEWRLNRKGRLTVIALFNEYMLQAETPNGKSRKTEIYMFVHQFAKSIKE
jgi:CRISPR-associated protein Cas1